MNKCILGCGNPIRYPKPKLCHACYARLHWQMKRGVSWIIHRQQRLEVWMRGLEMVSGNVRTMKRRKAA